MPFDATPITAPTLRDLSDVLRDRSRWPKDFEWDFEYTDTCDMGLAYRLWPEHVRRPNVANMRRVFGIPYSTASYIFLLSGLREVSTPEDVADLIDEVADRG